MENTSLITKLKKLNTILFSLIGLVVLVFCCWIAYTTFIASHWQSAEYGAVNVPIAQDESIKETLTLSAPSPINGTEIFIASLKSSQAYTANYSSKRGSAPSMRNILFTDMQDETTSWLFPKHHFVIPHFQLITDENQNDKTPLAVFYRVVKEDSNNDAKLSPKDKLTLALSAIDGSRYTEVFNGIDHVLGQHVINEKTFAISFSQGDTFYLAYIDLDSFKVTKKLPLPNISQGTP